MGAPPFTCTPGDPILPAVRLWRPDGSLFNTAIMTACEADWFCAAAPFYLDTPEGWTWDERPPIDLGPIDDVQSGN